ncbi:GxxExxY protein [Cyclobacterium roseum]|uniref:GxxExxY protein n=1 Tax=Cyclobacterium roseum TaxID=2666137 RepID=UPI001390DE10|nr:GxxExxY protein [Cyclobacterium roseum]
MELEDISFKVIGAAIEVHQHLGAGLFESAYQECLDHELKSRGLFVEKELVLPIKYKNIEIDRGYRVDLMVEGKLIVENKTVESFNSVHVAQLLTYLKFTGCSLGLLINWRSTTLSKGIKRVIL